MTAAPLAHDGDSCETVDRYAEDLEGDLNAVTEILLRYGIPADARRLPEAVRELLRGLPEWCCPSCGATTRARLADWPSSGSRPGFWRATWLALTGRTR